MPLSRMGRRAGVLLLAILLALALTWPLALDPFASRNLVSLLGFMASFLSAYALAHFLTGSRGAAVLCAIAYAYCPFVLARVADVPMLMTFGMPLALLTLHRLIDRPEPARAAALGAALLVQGVACADYGVLATLTITIGVIYYAVSRGLWRRSDYWISILFAPAGILFALHPLSQPLIDALRDFAFVRHLDAATMVSADWRAWLASSAYAHRWLLGPIGRGNDVLFPGFVTTILGLTGIWLGLRDKPIASAPRPAALPGVMVPVQLRSQSGETLDLAASAPRGEGEREPTRETTIFYTLLGAIAFWASFGPRAGFYTALSYAIPFVSLVRAPARFGIVVALALAVLMAIAVRDLLAKADARTSTLAVVTLGCVLVAELTAIPLY